MITSCWLAENWFGVYAAVLMLIVVCYAVYEQVWRK